MKDKNYLYTVLIFLFSLIFFILNYSVVSGFFKVQAKVRKIDFSIDKLGSAPSMNLIDKNWLTFGQVEIGEGYFLISAENNSSLWYDNGIELVVENVYTSLELEYLIESAEYLKGFDFSGLIISINDQVIFTDDFSSRGRVKTIKLDLSQFKNDSNLSIKIFSGNSGDEEYSSWVKLTKIILGSEELTDHEQMNLDQAVSLDSLMSGEEFIVLQ